MIRRALLPLVSLTLVSTLVACGTEDARDASNSGAGGSTATGGVADTGGTGAGTGGTGTGGVGTGGVGTGGTGTGGVGTGGAGPGGGGAGAPFTCPTTPGAALDLTGVTAESIATPPNDGKNRENLEGPVWIGDALYASNFSFGVDGSQILKYTPGGSFEQVILNPGTNGLAVDGAGKLYAARQTDGSISTYDLANPTAPPVQVIGMIGDKHFNSPNDLTLRADGNIYFTDPDYQANFNETSPKVGTKAAYWLSKTGVVTAIAGAPSTPNGISLTPDGNTLYIGGDSIKKYTVAADGSLDGGTPFGNGATSDGLTIDCQGNVYAASNGNVNVYSPTGAPLGSIAVESSATNVAFGGPNHTTLYITKMQPPKLFKAELNVPGLPY